MPLSRPCDFAAVFHLSVVHHFVPSLGEDKQALLLQHHGGILNDGFLVAVFGSMFLVSFAVQTRTVT
jgi:hypothetical protein